MYEGSFLTSKFLMTKVLLYAIDMIFKSLLRDRIVTCISRVGGWGLGMVRVGVYVP